MKHTKTGLAALLAASVLAAGTGGAIAQEPVTLTFWHTYNEQSAEHETLTGTLIPAFEATHPGSPSSRSRSPMTTSGPSSSPRWRQAPVRTSSARTSSGCWSSRTWAPCYRSTR